MEEKELDLEGRQDKSEDRGKRQIGNRKNEEEEREERKWNERENVREVERGRKKRLRGIEKNNNNNIDFSKQLFLNLKLHYELRGGCRRNSKPRRYREQ